MYKQRIGIRQSLHTTYCDIINMNMHRQDWNVNMQYEYHLIFTFWIHIHAF